MQYKDPYLAIGFFVAVLILGIFAQLFPEKQKPAPGGSGQNKPDEKGNDE